MLTKKKTGGNGRVAASKKPRPNERVTATKKKAPAKKKAQKKPRAEGVEITASDLRVVHVVVQGDSPLIVHKFSDKNAGAIRDKQGGKKTAPKGIRNPKEEYEAAFYHLEGDDLKRRANKGCKHGFPSSGFKKAMVDACSFIHGFTKVQARGSFHVMGNLTGIKGKPRMVEDNVRLPNGSGDLRYRPYFDKWEATLEIKYDAGVVSLTELVNLADKAGFHIGVGDWRPQRNGCHGMFHAKAGK